MSYDSDNIFAKILRAEAPAFKVYETDHALAFMDVKQAFEAPGIMIAQLNGPAAGQTVFHMHFHIMPRFQGLEFKLHAREMEDSALLEAHAERNRACLTNGGAPPAVDMGNTFGLHPVWMCLCQLTSIPNQLLGRCPCLAAGEKFFQSPEKATACGLRLDGR